jgi:hypothetical protein
MNLLRHFLQQLELHFHLLLRLHHRHLLILVLQFLHYFLVEDSLGDHFHFLLQHYHFHQNHFLRDHLVKLMLEMENIHFLYHHLLK